MTTQETSLDKQEQALWIALNGLPLTLAVRNLLYLWYTGIWRQLPDTWYVSVGAAVPGPRDPGRTQVPSIAA